MLVLFGRLLGPLLGGYLLFDKAFAYLRLPGTPLYVGELVLAVGVAGVVLSTRHLRRPVVEEPVLALLTAFVLWGLARTLPGIPRYGVDALRDAALWYYALFALLVVAALSRSPELLERLVGQLVRFTPWLLVWLPLALVLAPFADRAPDVPFSAVSVLTHKPGNASIAALLVLGCMWLVPGTRSPRSRTVWSLVALLVVALSATQNRGGLLAFVVGAGVVLAFLRNRVGLVVRIVLVALVGVTFASVLALKVPFGGIQGRDFSADQLVANVASLGGRSEPGNLGGTVEGRHELWTRILDKQVADGRLVDGSGFGPNLASAVGVFDEGKDTLRSPHNSHLDVLARTGLIGFALWVSLWTAWAWRLVGSCRRLARAGLALRHQVSVLCLAVAGAIGVSCFFDPQLEGPMVAVLLWTAFGTGVAVTSARPGLHGALASVPRTWAERRAATAP